MLICFRVGGAQNCGGVPFFYNEKTGSSVCGAAPFELLKMFATSLLGLRIKMAPHLMTHDLMTHGITTSANGSFTVFAMGMDGDGDMNVVSASYIDAKIAWHENNGAQSFITRLISNSARMPYSVFALTFCPLLTMMT